MYKRTLEVSIGRPRGYENLPVGVVLADHIRKYDPGFVYVEVHSECELCLMMRLAIKDQSVEQCLADFQEMKICYSEIIGKFPEMIEAAKKIAYPCDLPWGAPDIMAKLFLSEQRGSLEEAWGLAKNHLTVEFSGGRTWSCPVANIDAPVNDDAITNLVREFKVAIESESPLSP